MVEDQRGKLQAAEGPRTDDARFSPEGLTGENLVQINPGAMCDRCGYPALAHAVRMTGAFKGPRAESEIICPATYIAQAPASQRNARREAEDYIETTTAALRLQMDEAARRREDQRRDELEKEYRRRVEMLAVRPDTVLEAAYFDANRSKKTPKRAEPAPVARSTKREYGDDY